MKTCLPVKLNRPWFLNKELILPKRNCEDIPNITIPWILSMLKILLMYAAFHYIKLETTKQSDMGPVETPQFFATMCDAYSFIFLVFCRSFENEDDYNNCFASSIMFFILKSFFLLVGLVCNLYVNNFSYIHLAANIGSILVDSLIWRRKNAYYTTRFERNDHRLIQDAQEMFGDDHEFSQKINCAFFTLLEDEMETRFWNGTVAESRNHSIYPANLYCQRKNDCEEYFVCWDSYAKINERVLDDADIVEEMVERNNELRCDLKRQIELICQLRKKIYGPNVDCSDVNQLPASPPALRPWYPTSADGCFVSSRGSVKLYLTLRDYSEMADHAIQLRESISALAKEKPELKRGLQERKTIINGMLVDLINGELTPNVVFERKCIDDVD